ncbi:MAG: DUF4097 domain-containing protein [Turicibacter sp.]|nr:DUF4097 domain-containing protein [Turicibacter sp.]
MNNDNQKDQNQESPRRNWNKIVIIAVVLAITAISSLVTSHLWRSDYEEPLIVAENEPATHLEELRQFLAAREQAERIVVDRTPIVPVSTNFEIPEELLRTNPGISLALNVSDLNVEIQPHTANDILITYTPPQDSQLEMPITVTQNGGTVEIFRPADTTEHSWSHGSTNIRWTGGRSGFNGWQVPAEELGTITIYIPQNTTSLDHVNITNSGGIRITGDPNVLIANTIHANTTRGGITATDFNVRSAQFNSSSGNVNGTFIFAEDLAFSTSSGNITATRISATAGSVRFSASSGRVTARELDTRHLNVHVSSGNVNFSQIAADNVNISASSGGVLVEDSTAITRLSATVSSGSIQINNINTPARNMILNASSGTVRVDGVEITDSAETAALSALEFSPIPQDGLRLGSGASLLLNIPEMNVEIREHATDTKDILITYTPPQDSRLEMPHTVIMDGGTVEIFQLANNTQHTWRDGAMSRTWIGGLPGLNGWQVAAEERGSLTVYVPRNDTALNQVDIHARAGEVRITGSPNPNVRIANAVHVNATNERIIATNLNAGVAQLHSMWGTVDGAGIFADDISLSSGSGSVIATQISTMGDVWLSSLWGRVVGYTIDARHLNVNGSSSNMNLSQITAENVNISTSSGDVVVEDSAVDRLNASTNSGSIYVSNIEVNEDSMILSASSGTVQVN